MLLRNTFSAEGAAGGALAGGKCGSIRQEADPLHSKKIPKKSPTNSS